MRYVEFANEIIESFGKEYNFDPKVDSTIHDLSVAANSGELTSSKIKDFTNLLNKDKNAFIRMYHGTSASHPVMQTGLLPTSQTRARSLQSASGYVYLTYDPRTALNFAQHAYPKENVIVYAVDVTIRRLLPDHDQLRNKRHFGEMDIGSSLVDSLIYGNGARVKGKIEPYQIHIHGSYDRNGNEIN